MAGSLLVVVVKGTFTIPVDGKEPTLAAEQVPLVDADVFTGEPGLSAPLYESDYAPRKPRCDVLLNGSAYAPGGKPTDRVTVSLRVGSLHKSFDVVGNRFWKSGILLIGATAPEPFTVMPISYNNAFGGVDRSQEDPLKHRWYPTNHAGVGYHDYLDVKVHRRQAAAQHRRDRPAGHPPSWQLQAHGFRPDRPGLATAAQVRGHLRPEMAR